MREVGEMVAEEAEDKRLRQRGGQSRESQLWRNKAEKAPKSPSEPDCYKSLEAMQEEVLVRHGNDCSCKTLLS